MKNPWDVLIEVFGAAFRGASKDGVSGPIVSRLLLVFATLLAGCTTNRESATSPFFPDRTLTARSGEYGDEISYWDDAICGGRPGSL